ncbi:hypothetical protein CEP54_004113 [Fusarium duplospermum]|uniref:Uncharacterized protein n=1 Tax=Fusarium duplospermum TaxID=1325734 RepID=A0A428QK43_9HYPO|nr:hypothetical protein CEP54_004113 [Fusarium duplospermum]
MLLKYTSDDDEMRRDSFARDREKREYFWRAENLPWRLVTGSLVSFGLVPAVYSAWTMSRGFRVASGMTSTMTAMAVVPLRTASHIPQSAWIACDSTYVAWAVCFSIYIWLQLINIRHGPGPRDRKTMQVWALFASFHFMAGLSQGAESVLDGAALFGPIAATASAYFMSLLMTINWREAGRVVYELA